ncbi:MAG: peptidylprolyl isomerase [Alphaproteobacteria bacterium]|nr:peptidylprolyl isomerase [Alphaproteobacteria bacterium]
MQKQTSFDRESGNTIIIVLVVLAIVAVGALAYMSSRNTGTGNAAETPAQATAAQPASGNETAEGEVIQPGNPVVAKVGTQDVTRLDVFNFIQTLPPQTRQLPIGELFPVALEQVINAQVIRQNTNGANLDSDPLVKERVAAAKDTIVRDVFVQRQVEKRITDERLKKAYDQYVQNFPEIDEVKARHILVADKDKAKELIEQLDGGADFAELAKANSTDGTAQNGGEIGYFAQADVVPEFGDAAFGLDVGEYTKKPVETEFGYHVIQVQDKRKRPPATLEQAKPFLEGQMGQVVLNELISDWRSKASIERFDINGNAIEPASGDEETKSAE